MKPADVVAARFEIRELAGSGGMGSVYRAKDRLTGETVAVKTVRIEADPHAKRFLREARVLCDLRHPSIVRYIAHGVDPTGTPYLAMEWLDGEDLAARLRGRGLRMVEALAVVSRAAEALGVAHARGVVHRDVKPGNLLLVDGDVTRVKLLDFGIARHAGFTRFATRTGAMVGTPGYMAPEQARGDEDVDARADVFALGCVLYKCLVGKAPFAGGDMLAVAAKLLFEDPPRVDELRPEVPPGVADLCARMIAKDKAARPRDGAEVAELLDEVETIVEGPTDAPTEVISGEPGAITSTEQRLVSVAVALSDVPRDLAPLWDRLVASLAPFTASVERLADGSVVAILGGKRNAADQASQAARCALAMQKLLPDDRIALATGRGVGGGALPFGEVIDRAALLLPFTSEGPADREIRLDGLTAALLDARFEVSGEPPVLRGERDALAHRRTLLGKPTPCVGRERELGILDVALSDCLGEGLARAVVVTGPAGIGKSRLLAEFLARVRARDPGVTVWTSRGDPMSAGSPFGMLAQIVRQALGVLAGEPLEARRERVLSSVSRAVPADARRVAAFLGEIVGSPFPDDDDVQLRVARANSPLMGDQMQRAFDDLLVAEAARRPLLIVLEDLHWGDLPTVRFLDGAIRRLAEAPLFVLAVARPELDDLFPGLWKERSPTAVSLGDLSRRASERLVRAILGDDVPRATVDAIVERAGGNAFYLEELIRASAHGRGRDLPDTVLAMVQARLEDLEPEARRVLRAASVFGEVFWSGGVGALVRDTADLDAWLQILVERELVARRPEARFPDESELAFRHGLVRDAAYAGFVDDDRALGHRLAAAWLERAGETDALVLAEHVDRGGEPERSVAWYLRAAEQSLEGNDLEGVLARASRGLACGARGRVAAELWMTIAEARSWRGERAQAIDACDEAQRVAPEGSPPWWHAALVLSRFLKEDRLVDLAHRLAVMTPADSPDAIQALCAAASHVFFAGRLELAEKLRARVDALAPDEVDPMSRLRMLRLRATLAAVTGDLEGSLRATELAAGAAADAGDERNTCVVRVNLGNAYCELGLHDQAEAELRAALEAAKRLGFAFLVAHATSNLGWALGRRGAFEEGMALEREAVALFAAQGHPRFESCSRVYLSLMACRAGDLAVAGPEAEAAVAAASSPADRAFALGARATAHLVARAAFAALADATEAVRLLDEIGGAIDEGEEMIRLVHAEALASAGHEAEARATIARARERLLAKAARIADPEIRGVCLGNIAENARTLELASAWLGDGR